jgi:hypothetical protein
VAALGGHTHTYKLPFMPPLAYEGPISQLPHLIDGEGGLTIKLYQPLGPPPEPTPDPVTGPPVLPQ